MFELFQMSSNFDPGAQKRSPCLLYRLGIVPSKTRQIGFDSGSAVFLHKIQVGGQVYRLNVLIFAIFRHFTALLSDNLPAKLNFLLFLRPLTVKEASMFTLASIPLLSCRRELLPLF